MSGTYLLLKQNHFLAGLFLLGSFLFNQNYIFIVILILIIFLERTKSKNIIIPLISILITTFVFTKLNNYNSLNFYDLIKYYISDFGAIFGLGIFSIILFLIGFFLTWKDKSKNIMLYIIIFSLAIMSLFSKDILVFLDLIISFLAGNALFYLYKRKWESDILKNYVIILIFCGLIFTYGSYVNRISESGPYENEFNSLIWLSQQEKGKILSSYEYGFFISSISGYESYTNFDYYLNSKDKERIKETNLVFQSRNLDEIKEFFYNKNLTYIWINSEMKKNIWKKEDQGILLMLKNSRYFSKIYDYDVEIWKFMS